MPLFLKEVLKIGKRSVRKCRICKENINILKNDCLYLGKNKGYVHTECFKNKEINKKGNLGKEFIDLEIEKIKEVTKIKLKEIKNKQLKEIDIKKKNLENKITDTYNKDEFIKYIQSTYDIPVLNRLFYIKLAKINNGTYKGLKEAISYEDLLYMFQIKQFYLNKNADRKKRMGNNFKNTNARISYDLAVIINKYDSFKKWKQKQKMLEAEKQERIKEENNKIDFNYINNIQKNKQNDDNNEININELIDEI